MILRRVSLVVALFVLIINALLHGYPFFRGATALFSHSPIRMLILADPHLEGDSKIARMGWRGRLDIWGNDHYLGHIHRSMRFFTRPTHTVILGDHMSSQWIDDAEFAKRSTRMEERILKWREGDQVFNISGNHDIGYAGDMTQFRVNRWHQRFGPTHFVHHIDPKDLPTGAKPLRIVGMNNLNLDGPALDEDLRGQTHAFLESLPRGCEADKDSRSPEGCFPGATILLTHVPLHKEVGICVDPPKMMYYEGTRILLREQNHLSPESTRALLDTAIGDTDGIVLTGHDHEGCHVVHKARAQFQRAWEAEPFISQTAFTESEDLGMQVVQEVTVRSVMGQYGGNTGIMTGWVDQHSRRWRFHYRAVPFVHNTLWWTTNVVTILGLIFLIIAQIEMRLQVLQGLLRRLKRGISKRSRSKKIRTL